MALFTKLFPRLRTTSQNQINEDPRPSEKFCPFDAKQVRLVLFRECDFRGRKLLFDSDATQKISLEKKSENENFMEVSNGFGYLISKQNSDYMQLSEMIFGSVAMSYRGTYLKIHSISEPFRLMLTQVFPSPQASRRRVSSSSHHSHQSARSFDHSIRLQDDSGASSTYSSEPHLSDRSTCSTASDTVLVWKRRGSPLDLPTSAGVLSKNSLIVDSGCGDNHSSFSSVSTGPLRFDTWESTVAYKGLSATSLASFTHLKHLFRSSSRSLHSSCCSLPNSAEDVVPRGQHKSSKLGLAVIIDIPHDKQEFLTQFLMEHIALLESMLWRARLAIEHAYHRPPSFISAMMELSASTAQWLVSLISAPRLFKNLWHCLSLKSCDNFFSISDSFSAKYRPNFSDFRLGTSANANLPSDVMSRTKSCNILRQRSDNKVGLKNSLSYSKLEKSSEFFSSFNLGKFLKTDSADDSSLQFGEGVAVEKFLREFCELLETVDVKDTNFFVSTLLTAVLTHHLGWVATCFPNDPQTSTTLKEPYNALWSQLTDLYGAVGHPVKTAQTIVTGNNKNNVITKILHTLTYFIRFSNVERKTVEREDVDLENQRAEVILTQADCIPKQSYKKYEEHVRELLVNNDMKGSGSSVYKEEGFSEKENTRRSSEDLKALKEVEKSGDTRSGGIEGEDRSLARVLSKVKTQGNLSAFHKETSKKSIYEMSPIGPNKEDTEFTEIKGGHHFIKKPANLSKTLTHTGNLQELCNFKTETKFDRDLNENITDSNVIFVLGDNDKLVNIKKEQTAKEKFDKLNGSKLRRRNSLHNIYATKSPDNDVDDRKLRKISVSALEKTKLDTELTTRNVLANKPAFLNVSKLNSECLKNKKIVDPFREEFFCDKSHFRLKPSSSYESLVCAASKIENEKLASKEDIDMKTFSRCKSEPPEDRPPNRPIFKYSRVKFNLQQYPQVVRNYMRSKNLELESLSFEDKIGDQFSMVENNIKLDFSGYDSDQEFCEALQTPSNASELEGTSELGPSGQEEWCCGNSANSTITESLVESKLNGAKISWNPGGSDCSKSTLLSLTETLEKPKLKSSKSYILRSSSKDKLLDAAVKVEQPKLRTVKRTWNFDQSEPHETSNIDSNSVEQSKLNSSEGCWVLEKVIRNKSDILRSSTEDKLLDAAEKVGQPKLRTVKSSWIFDQSESHETSNVDSNLVEQSKLNSSKSCCVLGEVTRSKSDILRSPSKGKLLDAAEKVEQPELRTVKSSWNFDPSESHETFNIDSNSVEQSKSCWVIRDVTSSKSDILRSSSKDKLSDAEQLTLRTVKSSWNFDPSVSHKTLNIDSNSEAFEKENLGNIVKNVKEFKFGGREESLGKYHDGNNRSGVLKKYTNILRNSSKENILKPEETKLKSVKTSWDIISTNSHDKNVDIADSSPNKEKLTDVENLQEKKSTTVKSGWILGRGDSIDNKNPEVGCSIIVQKDWQDKEDNEKNWQDGKKLISGGKKGIGIPMSIVELPMPKTIVGAYPHSHTPHYSTTVIRGLVDTYIPDMVLQGTTTREKSWSAALKSNLALNAQHSLLDQSVEEALAILANTDTWEVQVISSHTYVIDKHSSGVRVGMSQLVSNMLESLLQMWKSHIPPQYCLIHIEQKLQELCVLSKALAQLLLASEFCSMELLTSTLHLEVNDVPLLMAVASTHTPQVTEKYGLSFQ